MLWKLLAIVPSLIPSLLDFCAPFASQYADPPCRQLLCIHKHSLCFIVASSHRGWMNCSLKKKRCNSASNKPSLYLRISVLLVCFFNYGSINQVVFFFFVSGCLWLCVKANLLLGSWFCELGKLILDLCHYGSPGLAWLASGSVKRSLGWWGEEAMLGAEGKWSHFKPRSLVSLSAEGERERAEPSTLWFTITKHSIAKHVRKAEPEGVNIWVWLGQDIRSMLPEKREKKKSVACTK